MTLGASADEIVKRLSKADAANRLIESLQVAGVDIESLAATPLETIDTQGQVRVLYSEVLPTECGVDATYAYRPPTITLHSTASRRDNFTVLHEYAHHLQRLDGEWLDALFTLSPRLRYAFEEEVCNDFASRILIPAVGDEPFGATALELADAYDRGAASHSAIAVAATRGISLNEDVVVAVFDSQGASRFAIARGQLFAPARGIAQPGVYDLITQCADRRSIASGLYPGLTSAGGKQVDNLLAELARPRSSDLWFGVFRPRTSVGFKPEWTQRLFFCPHDACGAIEEHDNSIRQCVTCGADICPNCHRCQCEDRSPVCEKCQFVLSAQEIAGAAEHECW